MQAKIEQKLVGGEAITPPPHTAVTNSIARVTGGNFRLVERLFAQIERIVTIKNLAFVTTEVVTLARERLVEGAT